MGRPKPLLPLGTGTVLSTVAERMLEAPIDRLVVVLGAEAQAVRAGARLPDDPRLRVVVNEDWALGLSSSLRAGLAASEEALALLVALGDQPGLDVEVIGRLLSAWRAGSRIAAVCHAGHLTHPVVFDRGFFPALRLLQGDAGARAIVKAHWDEVAQVEGPSLPDLDTPSDYEAFVAGRPVAETEGLDRS
jgi:CTP:molybdopterin cytidylyltransferase MocA